MNDWAPRIALAATSAAALAVLLVYRSDLSAAFLVPKFAALEIAASVGLLALVLRRRSGGGARWARPVTIGAWLVLGTTLLSWIATRARADVAPYAFDATARWAALFGLACGASLLDDAKGQRRWLALAISVGAAAVAVLGLLQHFEILPASMIPIISVPGSTFGNRNLAAEIMAMALPFAVATLCGPHRDARIAGGVATVLELVFLGVTRTRGSWGAAACGLLVVIAIVIVTQRISRVVVLLGLGALLMAGVIVALPARLNTRDTGDTKRYASVLTVIEEGFDGRSPALRTRLGLWRRSLAMIQDAPLLGVGPGNWPVVFPKYAEPGASQDGILSATLVPRQAHDDYLERTAETGGLGLAACVVLAVAIAGSAVRRLKADPEEARVATTGAVGALVALAALALLSFPLEMPGTITLAALALGLLATDPTEGERPWMPALFFPAAVATAALVLAVPVRSERQFRASYWLGAAEHALHSLKGVPGAVLALTDLAKCQAATPTSYLAELRTAQMLLREKRNDEAADAAHRVIAIEPYSPNGWGVLAAAHRAAGRVAESRDAATRGLELMHDYPLALDVRADAEESLGDAEAARADRDRIRDLAEHAEDDATRNTAKNLARALTPAP